MQAAHNKLTHTKNHRWALSVTVRSDGVMPRMLSLTAISSSTLCATRLHHLASPTGPQHGPEHNLVGTTALLGLLHGSHAPPPPRLAVCPPTWLSGPMLRNDSNTSRSTRMLMLPLEMVPNSSGCLSSGITSCRGAHTQRCTCRRVGRQTLDQSATRQGLQARQKGGCCLLSYLLVAATSQSQKAVSMLH